MKRIILIICALLLGLATRAQSVTYTCRYWFDQNFAQAATTTFSASTWQAELDVGSLTEGLHALHLHVMDTSMKWSAPQSYLFLKLTPPASLSDFTYYYWFDQDHASMQSGVLGDGRLLLDVDDLSEGLHAIHVMLKGGEYSASQTYLFLKADAWESGTPNYVYHCWFDEDFANQQTDALGSGHLLLDVVGLEDGMHTVHVLVEGFTLTSTQSYLFMKVAPFAADSIDMTHLSYHCWFDEDFEHQQIDSLGNGHLLLDVNDLEDGLHTVHVMLQGSTLTSTQSYMFMKMAVEDPSTEMQYICWFDQDYSNAQTGPLGSGLFELEVSDLPNGIHTVNVQLSNGTRTAPQCYLFYKQPLGGYGIARWEYWLNDDIANRQITNISPTIDTLDIITLMNVGHPALRSSCFHFHPNGDAPYINAKNQINFRFYDSELRLIDKSAYYVDEQVQQDIVAQVFERNTTETFAAPRDNQIQWFKLDAVVGDSLSFVASKACTMQLFAPSGEEVFNVSGPESIILKGLHAWEDGTYYLAVHDVTGSGDEISVTYNWVYRYAILSYNAHSVGNGGYSTITFQGNGFNSLLDIYFVNTQNDTIRQEYCGHETNVTTTAVFNFYEANLGVYNAVFQFYEEVVQIDAALLVEEPVDIVLSSNVSYPTSFIRGNTVTYTFTVTNNGNMSAYGVPLYVYIATPELEDISHIEFEGFNLPSILDYFNVNWDSIQYIENVIDLRRRAKEFGDEHNFNRGRISGGGTGTSRGVRSNYFYTDLGPRETKTMNLRLTPNEAFVSGSLEAWMTVPNETVPPRTPNGSSGGGSNSSNNPYCCSQELIQCTLGLICDGLDIAGLLPTGNAVDIASCICESIQNANEVISKVVCEGEGWGDAWGGLNKRSIASWAASCANAINPFSSLKKALDWADKAMGALTLADMVTLPARDIGTDVSDCITKWTKRKPDCPPGDSIGGPTEPRVPCEPNEIRGYLAESGSHYMMQEIQTITYEIESENDTTATAAAHTIIVRDTLDVNKFDVASLAAYRVTIHDKVLELSGEHNFVYTLDLRPNMYVIAQIQLECDDETGIVVWTITSLDPMTMEPTTDPNQGALPINYNGEGIATFTFNVNLKEPFPDGTEISNRVGIIFDLEEPVITDTWTNTVDAVKPTSYIEEVTPVADSLNFQFVSSDNRSGVWYHTLYYRNDSTDQQWQVRKTQIFENSFMLHLEDLLTTEYLVIAVDSAGNREEKEMVAEYIYMASGLHFVTEGNWSTASNWQEGTLPEADDVAFIDAPCQLDQNAEVAALAIADGKTLTVQSGKTLTVNGLLFNTSTEGLVIKDGAQLINASGNVAATLEKDITAYSDSNPDAWYTIASPMDEMPIAGSSFATPEFDLYRFNESNLTNEEWENYKVGLADFTTFENGRGYLFANSNAFSPAFTGILNASSVTYPLSYTERPNDPLSGFNLIGNPFPHDIYKGVGAAIDDANLASGYYTLTNEGTWQVHTFEDAIHPGQGILVKATAPTVLTIAKSTAVATAETGGAKRETSPLSISVEGENGMDQAFVYFGRGNSMEKMGGFVAKEPSLWVRDNGKNFAIAHVENANESLELCFSSKQSGDFTLAIVRNETEFEYLHLVDHVTGLTVDLLKQPTYVFHATGQEPDARFSIRFKVTE